jgi:RimJ/RimL family protein N-acetyltransferase
VFSEILTDRLLLRPLHPSDAENVYSYRADPEVARYQSWHPNSLEEVQSFIDSVSQQEFGMPGWYQIAIALRAGGNLIGDCGIHILESDSRMVEIGITIGTDHQAKGYATETLNAVLDLLFGRLCKHRVFASVDPRNVSSMALMKRLGLRKEAHFVQSLWFNDGWVDDVVFAILATEWQSNV